MHNHRIPGEGTGSTGLIVGKYNKLKKILGTKYAQVGGNIQVISRSTSVDMPVIKHPLSRRRTEVEMKSGILYFAIR